MKHPLDPPPHAGCNRGIPGSNWNPGSRGLDPIKKKAMFMKKPPMFQAKFVWISVGFKYHLILGGGNSNIFGTFIPIWWKMTRHGFSDGLVEPSNLATAAG